MIIEHELIGATVKLRSVNTDDAEFILQIRNDPEISKFLPPLSVTIQQQKDWINKQRDDNTSYYFLIEDLCGKRIGTISLYDIEEDHGETGRYCSYGDFIQNTEAVVLLYDFIFYELKHKYATTWVYTENKQVISMNSNTGFDWVETKLAADGRECAVGYLYPDKYESKMYKIKKQLKRMVK